MNRKYQIHRAEGLRNIIAPDGTLICSCQDDRTASILLAVLLVHEITEEIEWALPPAAGAVTTTSPSNPPPFLS